MDDVRLTPGAITASVVTTTPICGVPVSPSRIRHCAGRNRRLLPDGRRLASAGRPPGGFPQSGPN